MKYLIFLLALALPFMNAMAGDIGCHGKITHLMADHSGCIDDNGKRQLAFKTTALTSFMCARTEMGSSLLMAAKVSGKSINVYMPNSSSSTCSGLTGYTDISYMILSE